MTEIIGINGAEPRQLPHNYEAEAGILGAILTSNRAFDVVADMVKPEYFFDPFNGAVYAAMTTLILAGRDANPVTLAGVEPPPIDGFDMNTHLAALVRTAPTVINARSYAGLIRDLAQAREAITRAHDLAERAFEVPAGIGVDLGAEAAELIDAIDEYSSGVAGGFVPLSEAANAAVANAIEARRTGGKSAGVSTGLVALDNQIGGLPRGEVSFIAARTAMGKTALAGTIALNAARAGVAVAFFSLEMQNHFVANRMLSILSGVSGDLARRGKLEPADLNLFAQAAETLDQLPIEIDDRGGCTVEMIASRARARHRRGGARLIVIDYLGIVQASDRGERNRVYQVEHVCKELKRLAKSLDVPVLCLTQISRAVESRDDKRPTLADLRDSGAIEQEAGLVLMVYREEYYEMRRRPAADASVADEADWRARMVQVEGLAEIIVAKNRHGPSGGTANVLFNSRTSQFSDKPGDGDQRPAPPDEAYTTDDMGFPNA